MAEKLKLYRISQIAREDFSTYDSAVVVAKSEEEARRIYPGDPELARYLDGWVEYKDVGVVYLGEAADYLEDGQVIVASFNAG